MEISQLINTIDTYDKYLFFFLLILDLRHNEKIKFLPNSLKYNFQ